LNRWISTNTPATLNSSPAKIMTTAPPSPSIIWEPNPQSHSGCLTANDCPSGTWSGQVTLAPLDSTPSVTVLQPLRPQSWL
jgi:hypothetical protein